MSRTGDRFRTGAAAAAFMLLLTAAFLAWRFVPPSLYLRMTMVEGVPESGRSREAIDRTAPALKTALAEKGLALGAPVFIRIFKASSELEVWLRSEGEGTGKWKLFRTYEVRNFSGTLGPKLREGDGQAPEGFYSTTAGRLNPLSRFHLSFDIGYPNAYDRVHGRTGSAIMVHGGSASVGCFAMGDANIEEIYTLVDAALRNGAESIPVHVFPFRMTEADRSRQSESRWADFWRNLKEGYDSFEKTRTPPRVSLTEGRYVFEDGG